MSSCDDLHDDYNERKVALMKIGKYESSDKSNIGTAVTFLMIGLGAGALVALLLAPKTGKQMRKDLRRRIDDARDTLQDWSEEAQDRVQDVMERGADWADELRDAARPIGKALRRD
jgi:gas vesicle protein